MDNKIVADLEELTKAIENHNEVTERYKSLFDKLTELYDVSVMSSNSDSVDSCRAKFHEALDSWLCSRTNLGISMVRCRESYIACINDSSLND
jgi:hypothetical protein